jgi:hypothetical protein
MGVSMDTISPEKVRKACAPEKSWRASRTTIIAADNFTHFHQDKEGSDQINSLCVDSRRSIMN